MGRGMRWLKRGGEGNEGAEGAQGRFKIAGTVLVQAGFIVKAPSGQVWEDVDLAEKWVDSCLSSWAQNSEGDCAVWMC